MCSSHDVTFPCTRQEHLTRVRFCVSAHSSQAIFGVRSRACLLLARVRVVFVQLLEVDLIL